MIPNGSEVEVEFTVYTTSMSPGTRLESVKVLSLASMPERDEPKVEEPKAKTKVDVGIPF